VLVGDYDRDIQMAIHAGVPITVRVLAEGEEAGVAATVTVAGTEVLLGVLRDLLSVQNG
jgi:phosphoglycolate phosphatase-like HAD superfamily hydrolase